MNGAIIAFIILIKIYNKAVAMKMSSIVKYAVLPECINKRFIMKAPVLKRFHLLTLSLLISPFISLQANAEPIDIRLFYDKQGSPFDPFAPISQKNSAFTALTTAVTVDSNMEFIEAGLNFYRGGLSPSDVRNFGVTATTLAFDSSISFPFEDGLLPDLNGDLIPFIDIDNGLIGKTHTANEGDLKADRDFFIEIATKANFEGPITLFWSNGTGHFDKG
jgi:hypothetical protein